MERRVLSGGLREAYVVAFHPDGTYALILGRNGAVHVRDWATETATRVDVSVAGRTVYLDDLVFDPSGAFALIVGYEDSSGTDTGILIEVDDAAIRGGSPATAFTRLGETRPGERFTGIEYPPAGEGAAGDGPPVAVRQAGPPPGSSPRPGGPGPPATSPAPVGTRGRGGPAAPEPEPSPEPRSPLPLATRQRAGGSITDS